MTSGFEANVAAHWSAVMLPTTVPPWASLSLS
jgi:hypothetical protein